jgi:hypothetical protein
MNTTTDDPLADAVGEALGWCIERGFVFPLHAASVGVNGSTLVVRYVATDTGVVAEVLAEHYETEMFLAPVNIIIVDARGEAARVLISKLRTRQLLN